MVFAENADAIVRRSYYSNGALQTDILSIRSVEGIDFSTHTYALTYGYTMAGGVSSMQHPTNLAPSGQQWDQFGYDAAYDFRGRVDSATVVNPFGNGVNLTTRYRYDDRWDAPDTIPPSFRAIPGHPQLPNGGVPDSWGQPVAYTHDRQRFELRSAGPDAQFQSADDIVVEGQLGQAVPCAFATADGEVTCDTPPPACP